MNEAGVGPKVVVPRERVQAGLKDGEIQPVILCGGSGTRLWPLSRERHPKQLIPVADDLTMLQATVRRVEGRAESPVLWSNPVIVCNEEHRFMIAQQLREIGKAPAAILLEPMGRNTAPALTLAALMLEDRASNHDPMMLAIPADHVVKDEGAFGDAVGQAKSHAEKGALVTFGVRPTAPETGYGYIRCGQWLGGRAGGTARYIRQFVEKPDAAAAEQLLERGDALWNSGMFMMRVSVWLQIAERVCPEIVEICRHAYGRGKRSAEFFRVDARRFASCPADSVDYAAMEKVTDGFVSGTACPAVVVEFDAGWSDVGAWDTLWALSDKDESGNVVKGDVHFHDTCDTLVLAQHRLVTCVGIENTVVVETPDAVMVARRDRAQDVGHVVKMLKKAQRSECLLHRKVDRPWGSFDSIDRGDRFQVKRIVVNPGAALSLQMHHHRAEHWIVVKGTARVVRGEETVLLTENQSTYIPVGVKHRLENPGQVPLEIIEVQSGAYLEEDDIVRFDDAFGRR